MTILIVGSDSTQIQLLSEALKDHEINIVTSFSDANTTIKENPKFDIILSDYLLESGMSGLGFLNSLPDSKIPDTKILMTSIEEHNIPSQELKPQDLSRRGLEVPITYYNKLGGIQSMMDSKIFTQHALA